MNVALLDGEGFGYGVFATVYDAETEAVRICLDTFITEPTDAPVNNGDGGWD